MNPKEQKEIEPIEQLEKLAELLTKFGVREYVNVNNSGYSQIERDIVSLLSSSSPKPIREEGVKPEVICMCGSTKFSDLMAAISWEFEKQSKIVLRVNYLPAWYIKGAQWGTSSHGAEHEGLKERLDELHCRKIDMCDKVYVCDFNGYIGESTRNEINYALKIGKPVFYFYEEIGKDLVELKDTLLSPELKNKLTVWCLSQEDSPTPITDDPELRDGVENILLTDIVDLNLKDYMSIVESTTDSIMELIKPHLRESKK